MEIKRQSGSPSGPPASLYAYFGTSEGRLRGIPQRPAVTVSPDTTARNAMLEMNDLRSDTVVVVDPSTQLPLGLVTLRELVYAVAFHRQDLEVPVAALMTGAPFSLPADAPSHRATVLMIKRHIEHVLLLESDGRLCNVVSRADLFGLRGGGAEELAENVIGAADIHAMVAAAKAIRDRGAGLFTGGMGVEEICHWMSTLNDILAMRIIELVEDEFDLPAVPWCWLLFGSDGRLEQTFATDQDNGLIFLPGDEAATNQVREAFVPFARAVNAGLDACGFKLCRGNIMAGNPSWCMSLAEWQASFGRWMKTPEPEAILNSTIFFDFRPLYGSYALADQLRNWLLPKPAQYPLFLRIMAEQALACAPALGLAGRFAYNGGRKSPRSVDLKGRGARIFVDAARIWSLTHGIWATNTGDRLREAGAAQNLSPEETAADVEAFHLIQRFRIQQQLSAKKRDDVNRIQPATLNQLNRLMLKEALKQARRMQTRLRLEHRM